MTKIIEGTYTDYIFLFKECRTAYADLSAKAAAETGALYLLLEEEVPGGFLCLTGAKGETLRRVQYIGILPEQRGKGFARKLLSHAVFHASGDLRLSIGEETAVFPILRHLALGLGFRQESACVVFGSSEEKPFERWGAFMERSGRRLTELLLRQGFRVTSFADASEEMLEALYNSPVSDYQNSLDPRPFFDDGTKKLDRHLSFIGRLGGELAAYSLVSRQDERSAVFEHISASKKYRGSGSVFLPFAASMEAFGKAGLCRAAYTMYEDNKKANAFRRKLLGDVTAYERRSWNFLFKKETDK